MHIQPILIGAAWPAPAPILKAALELPEHSQRFAQMQICVQQVTLQQIAVLIQGVGIPAKVVVILEPLARLAADGEIHIAFGVKRNELDRIPEVRSHGGVAKV